MTTSTELSVWLRSANDHPPGRAYGDQLITQWRGESGALTDAEAGRLATAMDAAGYCFEPDIRFSGHVLRPADSVVFYPCDEPVHAPLPTYLAAATIARLGVIAASADGAVVAEEQTLLRERTSKTIELNRVESRRLEAYVDWLLDTPIALDALDNEAATLSGEDRLRIGRFLVAVAGADGYIARPERWMLAGTFGLFGLTAAQLDAEIASFTSSHVATPQRQSDIVVSQVAAPDTTERVPLSTDAVREALQENDAAIVNLAGLMPVAPVAPSLRRAHHVGPRKLTEVERTEAALDAIFLLVEGTADAASVLDDGRLKEMSDWETGFAEHWGRVGAAERRRPGSLLALVPPRAKWQEFITAWKTASLPYWLAHKADYPHALAVLFGGFAFFEYDDASFWPQFERDLWPLSPTQKVAIRTAHIAALDRLGLELARNQADDRMTVASAVHHIGVPLSIWADFLGVADYVLRQQNWKAWTSEHWVADVTARCGPRVRLRDFLTANEAAARETIGELDDIRRYAIAEPSTTIEDLAEVANVPLLRDEYFDDVPETAEFFRPDNLLSLFAGRCFLRYDDENSHLQIHLPGVPDPAGSVWRAGDHEQAARRDPGWFTVDGDGFSRWIDVHLDTPAGRRTRRVTGVGDWGLYDQRREAFLQLDPRHPSELRMGDYVLVSPRPLHLVRQGFLGEFTENQVVPLVDRTRCYVTRLSPAASEGSLTLRWATTDGDLRVHTVTFKTRLSTRSRTMLINGVEHTMGDPSLPWYFLRPGPYPPIKYASLISMELTKMHDQGSASAYARLKRYTEQGVIVARADGAWRLDHERARVRRTGDNVDGEVVEVQLLGLPTHMWGLGREQQPLSVEIVGEDGLTYLRATWPAAYESTILERLRRYDIDVIRS